jgi:hypothetical protein
MHPLQAEMARSAALVPSKRSNAAPIVAHPHMEALLVICNRHLYFGGLCVRERVSQGPVLSRVGLETLEAR